MSEESDGGALDSRPSNLNEVLMHAGPRKLRSIVNELQVGLYEVLVTESLSNVLSGSCQQK